MNKGFIFISTIFILLAGLLGCSSGAKKSENSTSNSSGFSSSASTSSSSSRSGSGTTSANSKAVQPGFLLQGREDQKVIDVIPDFSLETPADENQSSSIEENRSEWSHKFSITLKKTATVGELNALLNQLNARIVWSSKKSPNLEIRVPDIKDSKSFTTTLNFLKSQKNLITFVVAVEE